MKTALEFAKTATHYASSNHPPNHALNKIMDQVSRIELLKNATPKMKEQALEICWDAYAKVLAKLNSAEDESWGNAKNRDGKYIPDLEIVDNNDFAELVAGESEHADGAQIAIEDYQEDEELVF